MKHIIVLFLLISGAFYYQLDSYHKQANFEEMYNSKKHELLSEANQEKSIKKEIIIIPKTFAEEKTVKLKNNIDLDVQFYPQSPFGKWGIIFNDTCEEASALIAVNYILGKEMTREEFRDELLGMVDWQNEVFGDYVHTNVDATAQMMKEYLDFSDFEILENPTITEIKTNLNDDNIIIAPFYGKGMNPNFINGGPEYHFIVVKGYTQNEFITHEVGSKYGEDYKYDQEDLMDRLHDYDSVSVKNGKKRLIVLKK